MQKILLSFLFSATIFLTSSAADISLQGEWKGYRLQYDATKSKYVAEFEYNYSLNQVEDKVTGKVKIISKSGLFAEISVRGFIKDDKFYFEEYEVTNATRSENFLWCLKTGILDIEEVDGKYILKGNTKSFAEMYGFECSGGYTYLSREKEEFNEEIAENATSISKLEKSMNLTIFPNPMMTYTNLSFHIEQAEHARVDILDMRGNIVINMYEGKIEKGDYELKFTPNDNQNHPFYFVRIRLGNEVISRMIQRANY